MLSQPYLVLYSSQVFQSIFPNLQASSFKVDPWYLIPVK